MEKDIFLYHRKSFIKAGTIYFWTATINKWYNLLEDDNLKKVIIDSLEYLTKAGKIDVFAFVIMPNHMHLIWQIKDFSGKEKPHASFLKYTAHAFKKYLNVNSPEYLALFEVYAANKKYEFWQRDSLAVPLYSKETAFQKADYIHNNPLKDPWGMVDDPADYLYSSAEFYCTGKSRFGFLKDFREVF